jgi:hypothetical protein
MWKDFNKIIEKNPHIFLDMKQGLDYLVFSLQTLHRMPSEQWGCHPAFPTVFFCPKISNLI